MTQAAKPPIQIQRVDEFGNPVLDQTSSTILTERLLPIAEVKIQVGFGSSYIYELIQRGEFPGPVKVGNASRWRQSEIQAWIAEQIQNSKPYRKSNGGAA